MTSIRFHCEILEKLGLSNFSGSSDKFQYVYMTIQYTIICTFLICHAWSTCTRATRYLPEFYQTFLEDIAVDLMVVQLLCFNLQYEKITELTNLMENSCTVNSEVRKGRAKTKKVMVLFFLFVSLSMSGLVVQTLAPLNSEELEIQAHVYRTKHPERILMSNLNVPFIDETESYYYEAITVYELYLAFLFIIGFTVVATMIPTIIFFMEGQYTILCKHVENLGTKLRDSHGHRFFYTNLEKNRIEYFSSIRNKRFFRLNTRKRSLKHRLMIEKMIEQKYEKLYLRQIIYFHQKMMQLQQKVQTLFAPIILPVIICNCIAFSICLYQLTDRISILSKARMFKFLIQFITVGLQYFFLNNCSEPSRINPKFRILSPLASG
ncbi:hypothetical protein M8J76_013331 [Diaphorina citri]|nr:hypothetical protein M8J76_013331 [Diaphorina citri]